MTIRKYIRGVAFGALVAAPLAIVPATASADEDLDLMVVNEAPIPMYIETLGGGTTCWERGIPATTIPPHQSKVFPLSQKCTTGVPQATQTVVYGVAGKPEARINFVIAFDNTSALKEPSIRFQGPFGSPNVQLIDASFPPHISNNTDGNAVGIVRFTCPPSFCGPGGSQ